MSNKNDPRLQKLIKSYEESNKKVDLLEEQLLEESKINQELKIKLYNSCKHNWEWVDSYYDSRIYVCRICNFHK